ncbi:MAG: threonylcarbamoyl-AMP synthase [Desulfobulbus sp.]|uniref:L-threonylcarbamoyladenylate synthase n=1 Tax=Desulfobulbus sp. TaxID=895 RepID=UPI002851A220|nr:L-threonylcarbamoyladenylate synthase [Desulfobulbus sp.]MDR2549329.1 threonylcarbamoyl-AMP synthase [Desulfobulbus sp.]
MNWPVAADREGLAHAANLLRAGGVVAFPTETYYGLAVDPFNRRALDRLFAIKRRPRQLPILVLVSGREQLPQLTDALPMVYQHLIERFWPGPLTLVCPALPSLPMQLTGDTRTVGVRQSPHETAAALIAAFGGPVTATSANITGFPASISAREVARTFADEIDLIVDGGVTPGGCGSTLVGLDRDQLRCIREGKIAFAAVQEAAADFYQKR